jgi:hypothetical protein
MFILKDNAVFYGKNVFSKGFCYNILASKRITKDQNRGYLAQSHDVDLSDEMMEEIREVFSSFRDEFPVPPLVCRNTAEVLEYAPGISLKKHFDIPYCKEDFFPFVTVVNLNEGYEGGLHFNNVDLDIEGVGSLALSPSWFMSHHEVKEVKGSTRYSLLLDISYPDLVLRNPGTKDNWMAI